MKKEILKKIPELEELANQIGQFMVYWGFKEIHGRIWCHAFLSEKPVDAGELIRRLGVSKALISISLTDLLKYDVVQEVGKSETGTLLYQANSDLSSVITNVLKKRERKMMSGIASAHRHVQTALASDKKANFLSSKRVTELGELICAAETVLESFLAMSSATEDEMSCSLLKLVGKDED